MKKYEAYVEDKDGHIIWMESDDLDEIEEFTTGHEVFGVWDNECDTPVA